jgi:hypothetical protein
METSRILSQSNFGNSLQIAIMGNIPSGTFSISDGRGGKSPFLIKNITDDNITATVVTAGNEEPIETVLYPGWNVELIKEVQNVEANTLQYGF